ncbi:hypothetical protein [Bartonella apis]|uniref:hypothetical protein n=1 Tax=Bartonella apis TaxID=1686310 RepID=UPI0018DBB78C|nr:hypothetical protein [Bartonella apis]MBI0177520.1 hypothetical protein [Bartonella apis]
MDKSDIGVLSDIGVSRLFDTDVLHEKLPAACFSRKTALLTWPLEASPKNEAVDNEAAGENVLKSEEALTCGFCVAPSSGKLHSEFETAGGSACCGLTVLAPRSFPVPTLYFLSRKFMTNAVQNHPIRSAVAANFPFMPMKADFSRLRAMAR